jgi:hypothetical protein
MPGAWCTRSLVCKGRKHTSSHHRYAKTVRHSLRDGSRLIRALLGVPGLLATVASREAPAKLDPSVGRSGPHDFARPHPRRSPCCANTSIASCFPRPRRLAKRPSWWNQDARIQSQFLKNGRRIFGYQK